jgi:serine/threonine-protein kinase
MSNRACHKCSAPLQENAKFCLQCGAMVEVEAADAEDKLVGKIIADRYRVNAVLGEGGMGRVYVAEQKMGGATRKVAIKTLHPEIASDPQIVARFYRECETVIELSHPNTIQFYDFGKLDDGSLYIVMEFIQGESLAHVLQRGPLDVSRCDKILIQICGSLHEAHQRGIVHRDLKPENVLLTNRGGQADFVKVLDFGIAKRSEAEDEKKGKLTQQGMVLGTPPYMSPEQFGGQTLDARSDIYSLGVMVYEMLTGRLPFEAKTPWEWATKHLTAQPDPMESTPAGAAVPPHKRAAVMRALSKNRDQRQSTVLEFLEEFTGQSDAQAAWTMATSAGGAILPRTAQQALTPSAASAPFAGAAPMHDARTPAPTPGPMPQTAGAAGGFGPATPPPGYVNATGGQPYALQASSPGQSGYGWADAARGTGYATGTQPTPPKKGMGGVVLVLAVIGLFVVIGGGMGMAAIVMSDDDGDGPHVARYPPTVRDPSAGTPTPTSGTTGALPSSGTTSGAGSPGVGGNTGLEQMNAVVTGGTPTVLQPPTHDAVLTPVVGGSPTSAGGSSIDTGVTGDGGRNVPQEAGRNGPNPSGGRSPRSTPSSTASPADVARATELARLGGIALNNNNLNEAITFLEQAQRLVGRRHAAVDGLRDRITSKGGYQVGVFLLRNDCAAAKQLYVRLRSVGAESEARGQFTSDWCARP